MQFKFITLMIRLELMSDVFIIVKSNGLDINVKQVQ